MQAESNRFGPLNWSVAMHCFHEHSVDANGDCRLRDHDAGDKDAGGGRDGVRYVLAAAARVHPAHRLQTRPDRVREHLAEALLRRRLLGRALAGDEQQLRQPDHLRLSS